MTPAVTDDPGKPIGTLARSWFALTALAAMIGVTLSVVVAIGNEAGFFDTPVERALNVFAFFTIQSNLVVGIITAMLAGGARGSSLAFRVFRLTGIVAIAITFVVFHTVLSGEELVGTAFVSDLHVHTIVPFLAVGGWLLFGPHERTSGRVVAWSLAFPVTWGAFTLVRGAVVGFYPYPFIDVTANGGVRVARNCLLVAVLYLAVAIACAALDHWLSPHAEAPPAVPARRLDG
jgi:hypothetical protein